MWLQQSTMSPSILYPDFLAQSFAELSIFHNIGIYTLALLCRKLETYM